MNIQRYLPQILTGASQAGTIAVACFSITGTVKAVSHISTKKEELGRDLKPAEIVRTVAPDYIPMCAATLFTMACIAGANKAHIKTEALMAGSLAAAYEYRDKVKEVIGKDKEKDIYNKSQVDHAKKAMEGDLPPWAADTGKMWCYEPISKQYFQTTMEKILWAEMILNKELNSTWGIRFNKFLKLLGCKPYKHGDEIGWWACDCEGYWDYNWSYFGHGGNPWVEIRPILTEVDGQEVMMLVYDVRPDINPDDESSKEEEK